MYTQQQPLPLGIPKEQKLQDIASTFRNCLKGSARVASEFLDPAGIPQIGEAGGGGRLLNGIEPYGWVSFPSLRCKGWFSKWGKGLFPGWAG